MFNWAVGVSEILGMSPSQVFLAIHNVKDGTQTAGELDSVIKRITKFSAKESVQTSQPYLQVNFLWG